MVVLRNGMKHLLLVGAFDALIDLRANQNLFVLSLGHLNKRQEPPNIFAFFFQVGALAKIRS